MPLKPRHAALVTAFALVTLTLLPALPATHPGSGSTTCTTLTLMPGAFPAPTGTLDARCPARVNAPRGTATFHVTYGILAWEELTVDLYPRTGFDAVGNAEYANAPVHSCRAIRALNQSLTDCDGVIQVHSGFAGLMEAKLDGNAFGYWGWSWAFE